MLCSFYYFAVQKLKCFQENVFNLVGTAIYFFLFKSLLCMPYFNCKLDLKVESAFTKAMTVLKCSY